ncbi:MAG: RnfABCDGE type electron transport complex subunit G [Synergistaceae bacterium]|jgi:electron transport complex protein RnfG|nr:RnfABCDGE type electron transport complex subunit G [Synergistaceae bacterium]
MEASNVEASNVQANNVQASSNSENTKKIVQLGFILFMVTAITGVILGFVHEITLGPILQAQERLKNEALAGALPEAKSFSLMEAALESEPLLKEVQKAEQDGTLVGYCITVTPQGYGGLLEVIVGVTAEGRLRAIRILSHSETPGLGAKAPLPAFSGQFENKEVETLAVVKASPSSPEQVQAISGATITSNAVTSGVNAALRYWKNNLKGGN